ncbi:MAG TPA: ornithine cyclodeaminase [Roseiarcus sp.]|nr:ornithine cyclodeaminase [Roseiarcus sp.]
MRLIDADVVAGCLEPLRLIEALRSAHCEDGMGEVERLSVEAPGTANSALTWLAWHPSRGLAVKTATVFPGNTASGSGPNIQSVVTLFDAACGGPLAAIHGESFTRMKTAADSALGADLLARDDAATLAVLGAGGQAKTHVRFLRAVRPSIERVLIWNRTGGTGERLAAQLREEEIDAEALADPEAAVREAEVVSCLTASVDPVLRGQWLKAGAHVDLVGGFTPPMRESDDDVVRRGRLFADTLRFTLTVCGDYTAPIAKGVIAPEAVEGDLFGLCSGRIPGRRSNEEITVFKNGGGGHLDLIVARAIWDLYEGAAPGADSGNDSA